MPSCPIRWQRQHFRQVRIDALHHLLRLIQRLDACPVRVRRPVGAEVGHHLGEDTADWVRGIWVPKQCGARESSHCLFTDGGVQRYSYATRTPPRSTLKHFTPPD